MVIHEMIVRAFCMCRNRSIRALNVDENSTDMADISGGPPFVPEGGPPFPGGEGMPGGGPGGAPGGAAPIKPGDGFNCKFCR